MLLGNLFISIVFCISQENMHVVSKTEVARHPDIMIKEIKSSVATYILRQQRRNYTYV